MTKTTTKTNRGPYKSGIAKQKLIIDTAINLLVDEGYHSFSFRKVAKNADISVGNLQHYFPTRENLVTAMLDTVIGGYLLDFDDFFHDSYTPKELLHKILRHVILDLNNKQTTLFFPELWSLANHDKNVSQSMDDMYEKYRDVLKRAVQAINPSLTTNQINNLSLFMSASLEGHTIFIGHNKKWTYITEAIIEIAYQSFVHLIESGDIPE